MFPQSLQDKAVALSPPAQDCTSLRGYVSIKLPGQGRVSFILCRTAPMSGAIIYLCGLRSVLC